MATALSAPSPTTTAQSNGLYASMSPRKRHAGDELDEDADEVLRRDVRDRIEKLDPGGQIAGETVREEPHGKPEQPGHEAFGVVDGQAHGEPPETALLEPGEEVEQARRGEEDAGPAPPPQAGSRPESTKSTNRPRRNGRARAGRARSSPQPIANASGPLTSRSHGRTRYRRPGRIPPGWKWGPRPERQGHPGERLVELLLADRPVAIGRVVDQETSLVEPFENDEVVELPEQDHRQGHAPELFRLLAPSVRLQTVPARGAVDVGRVASIPTDRARLAQLLDGHPASEVREHDPEARGPALGLGELQQHRRAYPAPRRNVAGLAHPFQRFVQLELRSGRS